MPNKVEQDQRIMIGLPTFIGVESEASGLVDVFIDEPAAELSLDGADADDASARVGEVQVLGQGVDRNVLWHAKPLVNHNPTDHTQLNRD